MHQELENQVQIFQTESGALELKIDQQQETLWLSQDQIAKIFHIDQSVVSRHISNIFKDVEVEPERNMQKMHNANSDKPVAFYSLDVVLAVGYRTNSSRAIKFRQWANSILKNYLLKGYNLNQKLLEQKNSQILEIRQTLDFLVKSGQSLQNQDQFLEILDKYTNSLVILNQFDEKRLSLEGGVKAVNVEIADFRKVIKQTKIKLIAEKEATELFGQEHDGKFDSTIGAINQTFDGKDLYPTLEQKASHLLYFTIKNHSFTDGNKRIGSILFVYYLNQNNFLRKSTGELKINENTLVSLALLIAQSKPEDKDIIIQLVMKLIQD